MTTSSEPPFKRPLSPVPVVFPWPVLTPDLEEVILRQARAALSIYDRSGPVEAFEDAFGDYMGARYTLATSSGTAALHSVYYGASLGPGDEVICCDYGFFATVTPLVHAGATPVFVDCLPDGTIDHVLVERAITPRTRAVVVTHMWGQPARVDILRALCDEYGLLLVEDCSHAHGARLLDRPLGSYGHAAAWSLQAGKTLWAGEGGVLCTERAEIYERALLLGHFNRRALQEIPRDSPNQRFAFTGTGLKYRAHPLGLALAARQVESLDDVVSGRQTTAGLWIEALKEIPGIRILGASTTSSRHGYYSLVCLVAQERCGFDREQFVQALHSENIMCVSASTQMGSLHQLDLFREAARRGCLRRERLISNAETISAEMVRFFVPVWNDLQAESIMTVAQAISVVGRDLCGAKFGGRSAAGPD